MMKKTIVIKQKRKKTHLFFLLGFITLFSFFGPVLFLVFYFEVITKSYFLTVVIFWVVSFYFLRLLLWNLYGEERVVIYGSSLSIYHDYKWFTLFYGSIRLEGLSISYLPVNGDSFMKVLIFRSGDGTLKTSVPLKLLKAREIRSDILSTI